jgi:hypothetical protein
MAHTATAVIQPVLMFAPGVGISPPSCPPQSARNLRAALDLEVCLTDLALNVKRPAVPAMRPCDHCLLANNLNGSGTGQIVQFTLMFALKLFAQVGFPLELLRENRPADAGKQGNPCSARSNLETMMFDEFSHKYNIQRTRLSRFDLRHTKARNY